MWKRPDFRRVNLLGIYFMALHTAFSVEERYLAAIVPLLAAVVVISVFALAGERANDAARKEGTFLFAVGAVPPVLLCLFCVLLLLRHPGKIPQADVRRALAAALAGHPGNSWLLSEQGRSRLLNGDYAGAYDSLGKAVILSPGDMSAKIDLAVAALLKNQKNNRPAAGADLITKMLFPGKEWPFPPTGKEYILKALYEIDKGREQEAQKSIRQALKIRRNSLYFKLKSDIIDEEKLRSFDNAIAGRFLLELAAYFPAGKKEKLCSKFIFMYEEGKLSRQAAYLWCDNMLWQMRAGWKEVSFTQRDYMQPVAKPGTASAVDNKNRDDIRNIISALSRARKEHKRVILQLGGEWCDWCKRMDDVFKHDRGIAAFLDRKYILVKISVGQNDPPPPAVAMYPRLNSCPYLYVLGCDGAMLISKSTESFEIGEGYDRDEIMSFLRAWAPDSPPGL